MPPMPSGFASDYRIDVSQWSTDPVWRGRIQEGERWLSTNHLMGPGYWVWLIPLCLWFNKRWHCHRCEDTRF